MKNIIRIYRGWKGDSKVFLGTVELPGDDVKLAFSSFDELRNILGPLAGKVIRVEVRERQKSQKRIQCTLEAEYYGPEAIEGNVNRLIEKEGEDLEGVGDSGF